MLQSLTQGKAEINLQTPRHTQISTLTREEVKVCQGFPLKKITVTSHTFCQIQNDRNESGGKAAEKAWDVVGGRLHLLLGTVRKRKNFFIAKKVKISFWRVSTKVKGLA